jgi:hypothetical protein
MSAKPEKGAPLPPVSIQLTSTFERSERQLHVARFMGMHGDVPFDPSQLATPVAMERAKAVEMPEWQKLKKAKVCELTFCAMNLVVRAGNGSLKVSGRRGGQRCAVASRSRL